MFYLKKSVIKLCFSLLWLVFFCFFTDSTISTHVLTFFLLEPGWLFVCGRAKIVAKQSITAVASKFKFSPSFGSSGIPSGNACRENFDANA